MNVLARAATLAGAAALAVTGLVGTASAATGATVATVEQAGYAATGAQFDNVQTSVYLRKPAKYASEVAATGCPPSSGRPIS
jgi:hypothetical protein